MAKTFLAVSALTGTIIGAGYLGIPYVISKSGFPLGLLNLAVVCAILLITMLYLGEISLRTKAKHQLPGYAEKYLGKKGKILMFLALIFGIYSALLAYLIAQGESLSFLIFGTAQYSLHLALAFWLFLSLLSYLGVKALKEADPIGLVIILIMIISLAIFFWNKIDASNLIYISPKNFYIPFSVIVFAFLGFSAVPTVHDIIGEEKRRLKKVIVMAHLIPLIIYTIFALIVLGSQGPLTPEIATLALGKPFVLLSIITMFLSYLNLSIALMNTYKFDFQKSKFSAWLYTILLPIVLYLILKLTNNASFIKVIGIGGIISGGLTAAIILFMIKKAKAKSERKPEFSIPYSPILAWILIALFLAAAILEIIHAL